MTGAKYCEGCGKAASTDARFCGACARPFPSAAESGAPTRSEAAPAGASAGASAGEEELFLFRPLVVQGFGELVLCVLSLGIAWLVLWLRRRWIRCRITTQRIEILEGVLDRRRETIELFRIQDFELQEPLFLRLRASGNLLVRSMDPEEGEILLRAVPDVSDVYERVRRRAIDERERHRVRLLEGMS